MGLGDPQSIETANNGAMRIELLLFLSLMVMIIVMIACSAPRRPTPGLSPTLFPVMTLTTYDPQMIARITSETSIGVTISPPSASHPELSISPPRCYRTASPMLTCLGAVRNAGRNTLRDIVLQARFRRAAGELAGEHVFGLVQRRLEADVIAPYRFFAPARRDTGLAIEIGLVGAQLADAADVTLTLDNERGEYLVDQNRYRFTALVRNDGAQPARRIRLIVSLENAEGANVGFRAVDIAGDLSVGETRTVEVTLSPIRGEAPARHRVSLDALPAERQ